MNTERTKYMVMSRHQNTGENHNLTTANKSFENLAKVKYMGTTSNCIHEEIKSRLNSGAEYHLVQNLLSFRLISKNLKE